MRIEEALEENCNMWPEMTRRATRHLGRGGLGGNISRKIFWPPLNFFFGGGQEKCVLYLNNKKTNLTNRIFSYKSTHLI